MAKKVGGLKPPPPPPSPRSLWGQCKCVSRVRHVLGKYEVGVRQSTTEIGASMSIVLVKNINIGVSIL